MNKQKKRLSMAAIGTLSATIAAIAPIVTNQIQAATSTVAEATDEEKAEMLDFAYKQLKETDRKNTAVDIDAYTSPRTLTMRTPIEVDELTVEFETDVYNMVQTANGPQSILKTIPSTIKFSNLSGVQTIDNGKVATASLGYPAIESNGYNSYTDETAEAMGGADANWHNSSETVSFYWNNFEDRVNSIVPGVAVYYVNIVNRIKVTSSNSNVSIAPIEKWTSEFFVETKNEKKYPVLKLTDPTGKYIIEINNVNKNFPMENLTSKRESFLVGYNNAEDPRLGSSIYYTPEFQKAVDGYESGITIDDSRVSIDLVNLSISSLSATAHSAAAWSVGQTMDSFGNMFDIKVTKLDNCAPTLTFNNIDNQHYDATGHTVTISGTTTDSDGDTVTVSIYNGETKLGDAIVSDDGTWSYDLNTAGMENGSTQNITAVASDGSSEVKITKSFNITNNSPEATINNIDPKELSYSKKITGTWSDSDINPKDTIKGTLSIDNNAATDVTINSDGTWSCDVDITDLPVGSHTVTLSITDGIATVTKTASFDTFINITPSIFVTMNDIANQHYDANGHVVTISGTVSDTTNPITVKVSVNDTQIGTATANNGQWSFDVNTSNMAVDSTQTVSVIANDGTTDSDPVTKSFKIVNTPTTVTINKISDELFTGVSKKIAINGTWSDTDTNPVDTITGSVSIDGTSVGNITVNNDGTWTCDVDINGLSVGSHNIQVFASDGISDAGQDSTTLNITNSEISFTLSKTEDTVYEGNAYTVDLTAQDENVGQKIEYYYSIDSDSSYVAAGSTTSNGNDVKVTDCIIPSDAISIGTHTIYIKVSDGISEDEKTISLNVEENKSAPIVSIEKIDNQPFTSESNIIKVTVQASDANGDDITLSAKLNDVALDDSCITDLGNGKYEVSINLANKAIGDYTLSVEASDGTLSSSDASKFAITNTASNLSVQNIESPVLIDDDYISFSATVTDANIGQNISIEYQLNNGDWVDSNISFTNNKANNSININVPLNSSMLGKNTIKFRAFDGIEYSYDNGPNEAGYSFECIERPYIKLSEIPNQLYTTSSNKVVVSGHTNYLDATITAVLPNSLDYTVSSIDDNGNFTIEFDSSSLPIGSYTINLGIRSEQYGGIENSSDITGSFNVVNDDAKLTVNTTGNTLVNSNTATSQKINASINIEDKNIGQDLKLYQRLQLKDGSFVSDWVEIQNISHADSSININMEYDSVPSEFNVPADCNGECEIVYVVMDSNNEIDITENNSGKAEFSLVLPSSPSLPPIDRIKVNFNLPSTLASGKEVPITVSTEGLAPDEKIYLYCTIDNGEEVLVGVYTAEGSTQLVESAIPADLNTGAHTITYTAVAPNGDRISNTQTFEVAPDVPETPDKPDTPENPDTPDTPESPDKPNTPETPDKPDIPENPDKPDTPENPDKPNTPETPDKPDTPETPDKPDTPNKPVENTNAAPVLYISEIKENVAMGETIKATLVCEESDDSQNVEIYYEIDGGKAHKVKSFTSNGKKKTIDVEIDNNFDLGKHTIVFYAIDENDAYSNEDGNIKIDNYNSYKPSEDMANKATFYIENSAPELYVTKYSKNINSNDKLSIEFAVQDVNKGQKIKCYYTIDNSWPTLIGEYTSDGNLVVDSLEIPNLASGEHVITLFAEDEFGVKSNNNGDTPVIQKDNVFSFVGNNKNGNQISVIATNNNSAPVVDIVSSNTYSTDKDVIVKVNVRDTNKNQTIVTYASIGTEDGQKKAEYVSDGTAVSQEINLGKLPVGKYSINIWAVDESGARSDVSDNNEFQNISSTVIVVEEKSNNLSEINTNNNNNTTTTTVIKTGVEEKTSSIATRIIGLVVAVAASIGTLFVSKRKRK